jgi:amino acid transporter
MIEQSILFPSLPAASLVEILIVLTIASLAYFVVFNNFEKHLPIKRRAIKLFIVVGILAVIGILFSRYAFWGMIALMTAGQVYLHGWYFPKHGINGLTAEPHDKYLEVIKKMKGDST